MHVEPEVLHRGRGHRIEVDEAAARRSQYERCDVIAGQRIRDRRVGSLGEGAIEGKAAAGARRREVVVLNADEVRSVLHRVPSVNAVNVHFGVELVDVPAAGRVASAETLRVARAHRDRGEQRIRRRPGEAGREAETAQIHPECVFDIAFAVACDAGANVDHQVRPGRPGVPDRAREIAPEKTIGIAEYGVRAGDSVIRLRGVRTVIPAEAEEEALRRVEAVVDPGDQAVPGARAYAGRYAVADEILQRSGRRCKVGERIELQ